MDEKYIIQGQTLKDIADAVRSKTKTTDQITPENMPSAIESIKGTTGVEIPNMHYEPTISGGQSKFNIIPPSLPTGYDFYWIRIYYSSGSFDLICSNNITWKYLASDGRMYPHTNGTFKLDRYTKNSTGTGWSYAQSYSAADGWQCNTSNATFVWASKNISFENNDSIWYVSSPRSNTFYDDGKTIGEKLYLYKLGDECSDVTGGWVSIAARPSDQVSFNYTKPYTLKVTSNSAWTKLEGTTTDGTYNFGLYSTKNKIDLSQYSKLVIKGVFSSNNRSNCFNLIKAVVSKTNTDGYAATKGIIVANEAGGPYTRSSVSIDISSLTTEEYIALSLASHNYGVLYCYPFEIYLEK